MFPDTVEIWCKQLRRYRGQFLIFRPNYQWYIDGYDKLKVYSFKIYIAIDVYLRYIIQLYVGHSVATFISVLKQYLEVYKQYIIRLWFLQADLGKETPLVATAYWHFAVYTGGEVNWNGRVF